MAFKRSTVRSRSAPLLNFNNLPFIINPNFLLHHAGDIENRPKKDIGRHQLIGI